MTNSGQFIINLAEAFPHLKKAPIVEAVIDVRARASTAWESGTVGRQLREELARFPQIQDLAEVSQVVQVAPFPGASSIESAWTGLRAADSSKVLQMTRDGMLFSQLPPYGNWEQFAGEGLRIWSTFARVAKPADIARIGVRFINRIPLPPGEMRVENYIYPAPATPLGLPLEHHNFFYQDTLGVPGDVFAINIIKTIQVADGAVAVILDIDVFTLRPCVGGQDELGTRLKEMRWLKNKAFFGSITPAALELFR